MKSLLSRLSTLSSPQRIIYKTIPYAPDNTTYPAQLLHTLNYSTPLTTPHFKILHNSVMPFSNALNDTIIRLQAEICAIEDLISERNKFILDLQRDFLCMLARELSFEALVSAGYVYGLEEFVIYGRIYFILLDIEAWVQQTRDCIADDEKEFDGLWEQLHEAVLMEQ